MKQKMFTVYDATAEAFLPPFFMPNTQTALRAIEDCVSDENHNFHKHSSDYTLYELGSFDDAAGLMEPLPQPKVISLLSTIKGDDNG